MIEAGEWIKRSSIPEDITAEILRNGDYALCKLGAMLVAQVDSRPGVGAMAQAWWETVDEIITTPYGPTGPELRFQKGRYHYHDGSPPEDGYRFIWRKNGKLQSRPARIDDLKQISGMLAAGAAKGWK